MLLKSFSRWLFGSVGRITATLAICVGLFWACRTVEDDTVIGAETYLATIPDIGGTYKMPQTAQWRLGLDSGTAGLSHEGMKVMAWVDLESSPLDTVWIDLWRAGVREQQSAFLFQGTARLKWLGVSRLDSLALEILRRMDPSSDSALFDTLLARALVDNDSIVRGYGFPARSPIGVDTAQVLRIAMVLMVNKQISLGQIIPQGAWALGIDTLSVHVRVRSLCSAGVVSDTSKIFPHPAQPTDTTKTPIDTTKAPEDTTKVPADTTTTPTDTTKAPTDTLGPAIRIAAPLAGTFLEYFQDSLEVRVLATDASGIDSVRINQFQAQQVDSFWVLPKLFVPVAAKGLDLVVEAWDRFGNRSSASIRVGRKAPPPPKSPYHAVLQPATAAVPFDSTSVMVRWMVYDPASPIDSVRINGEKATYEKDSVWSLRIRLDSVGVPFPIRMVATTAKGATIADTLKITRQKDLVGPAIRFVGPADKQIFEYTTDSLTLVVEASDPSGLAAVKIGGIAVPEANGQFLRRVALEMGKTAVFSAEASDSFGNLSSATISVTRQNPPDTLAPKIELIWPLVKSGTVVPFDSQSVLLRWVVTDVRGLNDTSVKIAGLVVEGVHDTFALPVALRPSGVPESFRLDVINSKGVATSETVSLARAIDAVRPVVARFAGSRTLAFDSVAAVVGWTVTDNHKLSSVSINNVAVAGVNGVFQRTVVLQTGTNLAILVAMDSTGNTTRDTVDVVRIWKDATKPVLTRNAGTASRGVDFDSVTAYVSWNVTDQSPIDVTINGREVTEQNGAYSLAVPLPGTVTYITIVATDSGGNTSSDEVTITKSLDTMAPTLSPTTETRSRTVDFQTESVRVAWVVSDNGALKAVNIFGQLCDPTDSEYALEVALEVGTNVIWIQATDQAGNMAHDTIVIERRDLDTSAPQVIRSDSATRDQVVSHATVLATVSWKVSDASLSQVLIGDSVIHAVTGVYARTFDLVPGENALWLNAMDSSGNATADTVFIKRTEVLVPTVIGSIRTFRAPSWQPAAFDGDRCDFLLACSIGASLEDGDRA